MQFLTHHGIKGQRWGVRRFQNEDGSLTAAGERHRAKLEKKDVKWAKKNYDKYTKKAYKPVKKELSKFAKDLDKHNVRGLTAVNAYNRKMAELMNRSISSYDITSPSGRSISFIAKRGEIGVHMALADKSYDISKFSKGIWADGRVAYKKQSVEVK